MPQITFVIPAFNAASTLGDAVRSVLDQAGADLELIVIDDGSTDGTSRVAGSFSDPRVALVRRANRGVAATRNLGLMMARGEFICFLDADDALEPDFARATLGAIGDCDAIATAYRDTDPSLKPTQLVWCTAAEELLIHRLRETNPLALGATVFRVDALHQLAHVHGEVFPSDSHIEDWEMLLRFTALGGRWARPIDQPLMLCRMSAHSRSSKVLEIWKDGCEQIGRWVPRQEQTAALRRWTLRQLMRAVFAEQPQTIRSIQASLGELRETDTPVLSGMARSLAERHAAACGQNLSAAELAQRLSPLGSDLASSLASRAFGPGWDELALRAAHTVSPQQRLVVYGFGRNGREAARALVARSIPFATIDDDPASHSPNRITIADLGPRDVVVVTPDEQGPILARLKSVRVAAVLTAASLARPDAAAA
ncbi:MAG: glycosyltransferase family 2 protein [Phycisphaerales bacterium]|nr:glycosyltransferase family 2 protein [Planctomycetota bacterium]